MQLEFWSYLTQTMITRKILHVSSWNSFNSKITPSRDYGRDTNFRRIRNPDNRYSKVCTPGENVQIVWNHLTFIS